MRSNTMKEKLRAGQRALGLSVMIPSAQIVEMAGGLGFDWVLIDCEHGTVGLETAELMIMAAEAAGVTPIVRPKSRSYQDIVEVMDRGAAGVQVPHVIDAASARAAVDAVKFHPVGRRSLAAGTRASGYGYRGSAGAFVEQANAASLVCVQIEDEAAIHNIDEILTVEHVDVFFIGPSDLSASMGFPGNPKAEPVARAIESTLKKITAAGKTAGMPATSDTLDLALSRGVRYIYNHLPNLLAAGSAPFVKGKST
jgi:2-keto-3-deoxy-L-rhamnonate aldolase RhmA